MRVIYADPGLADNLGHHANSCRFIRREMMRRGIIVPVLSCARLIPELREEFQAVPLFRTYTYWLSDGDPVCGWLNCFDIAARATVEDLSRVSDITADDIVYLNSAQPAQFMAMVTWAKSRPMEQRPHVVLEFGTDPGIDAEGEPGRFTFRLHDYRTDPRAMFYRHTAGRLNEDDLRRFHMVTFDSTASEVYSRLLARPVTVLPLPQSARTTPTSRVGRRPITVSVLGHQRSDKGYHHMPSVARLLLAQQPDIRLLLHNGAPDYMRQTQQDLRDLAAVEPRVMLDERTADAAIWQDLLDRSDLMLCPYERTRFVASYSAVATEAVANGIPLVVPAHTTLARLIEAYGGTGTSFDSFDPPSIVDATRQALADFDGMAARAAAAVGQWNATMGPGPMVTALLACCGLA